MDVNSIEPNKKKKILEFFKENFDINIEKYTDEELLNIIKHTNKTINKRIKEEQKEYEKLMLELEKKKLEILSTVNFQSSN